MASRKHNPELARLRAEVLRKQRNAAAKINRNKKQGIHIAASNSDPRVNVAKIARYTAQQLINHGKKLDEFTNRRTAFVAGAAGQPIPKQVYNRYKALEAAHNAIGDARMGERGEYKAPGSGMSIREREDTFRNDSKRAKGHAVNRPLTKIEREAYHIASVDAALKLISDLERKISPDYIKRTLKDQRKEMNKMLIAIGDANLIKQANKLSDYQFDVLFNDTKFATDLSQKYEIRQSLAAGRKERWFDSVGNTNTDDIIEAFTWASALPKTNPTARQ